MRRAVHPRQLRKGLGSLPNCLRKEPRAGKGPIDEVADRDDLGERLAVRHEHRHLAVRVEGEIFGRALLALVQLDELRLERLAAGGLRRLERDVRDERAGAGREM